MRNKGGSPLFRPHGCSGVNFCCLGALGALRWLPRCLLLCSFFSLPSLHLSLFFSRGEGWSLGSLRSLNGPLPVFLSPFFFSSLTLPFFPLSLLRFCWCFKSNAQTAPVDCGIVQYAPNRPVWDDSAFHDPFHFVNILL